MTRVARETLQDKKAFVYFCKLSGYFGIGFFPSIDTHKVFPGAARGTRVLQEMLSLGTDLNQVGPEKIVELRQRLKSQMEKAAEQVREVEQDRLIRLQEEEDENQQVRNWLTQETGKAAPTSMWNRDKIRFSFAGKGGKKARTAIIKPSFGNL